EKRVFLVILFTSFSGSLVSRIPGAVQAVHHTMLWKYGRAGQIGRFDNTSDGVPVSGKVAGRVREKT
ncbi:hypothetical protein OSK25_23360, partial [Escherichia coli]